MATVQRETCENCMVKAFMNCNGKPTAVASLGFRIAFTLLSVLILGICPQGTSSSTLFSAYLMFSLPMLKEYLEFTPTDRLRKVIKGVEIIWHVVIILVSLLCLCGVLELVDVSGIPYIQISKDFVLFPESKMRVVHFWAFVCVTVGFCVSDWMLYGTTTLQNKVPQQA